jgi:hypothetical protein
MLKLTSSRLQLLWGLCAGAIAIVGLLPCWGLRTDIFEAYFNGHWVHFLAYAVVSFLPLLAWRRNQAFVVSMGMAALGTGLEIVRSLVEARPPDIQCIVINALGIAAGILLGLNIVTRRSRMSQTDF